MFAKYVSSARAPFADWVTFDRRSASGSDAKSVPEAHKPSAHGAPDLDRLVAGLGWTLADDSDAVGVIQRLADRAGEQSDLARRARTYAAELSRVAGRLASYVPFRPARKDRDFVSKIARTTIESLDRHAAAEVLVGYILRHVQTNCEILAGIAGNADAKAIRMLCRKAAREKRNIAEWIARHSKATVAH